MNAEEYKKLIKERNVLNHTTLNVTLKELVSRQEEELIGKIRAILENGKIAKPDLHSSPYDHSTTYYTIDLNPDDIDRIISIFYELEESHMGEDGETTPTASFYASLADKWESLV